MQDNDNYKPEETLGGKEPTIRVTVRLPVSMVRQVDELAGPYRERTSMILEIIGEYLKDQEVRKLERIAQGDVQYGALLARLRRDLGLDQSSGED